MNIPTILLAKFREYKSKSNTKYNLLWQKKEKHSTFFYLTKYFFKLNKLKFSRLSIFNIILTRPFQGYIHSPEKKTDTVVDFSISTSTALPSNR